MHTENCCKRTATEVTPLYLARSNEGKVGKAQDQKSKILPCLNHPSRFWEQWNWKASSLSFSFSYLSPAGAITAANYFLSLCAEGSKFSLTLPFHHNKIMKKAFLFTNVKIRHNLNEFPSQFDQYAYRNYNIQSTLRDILWHSNIKLCVMYFRASTFAIYELCVMEIYLSFLLDVF